jgi:hypothetical protein
LIDGISGEREGRIQNGKVMRINGERKKVREK